MTVVDATYHSCQLGIGVISRCDFDNVRRDNVEAVKTSENGAKFTGGPSTCLWGSSRRGKRWVNGIDLRWEISWK